MSPVEHQARLCAQLGRRGRPAPARPSSVEGLSHQDELSVEEGLGRLAPRLPAIGYPTPSADGSLEGVLEPCLGAMSGSVGEGRKLSRSYLPTRM